MRFVVSKIEWGTSARKAKAHELPGEIQIDVPDEIVGDAENIDENHAAHHWIEGRLSDQFGHKPERFSLDRWEDLTDYSRWQA